MRFSTALAIAVLLFTASIASTADVTADKLVAQQRLTHRPSRGASVAPSCGSEQAGLDDGGCATLAAVDDAAASLHALPDTAAGDTAEPAAAAITDHPGGNWISLLSAMLVVIAIAWRNMRPRP